MDFSEKNIVVSYLTVNILNNTYIDIAAILTYYSTNNTKLQFR